MNAILKLIPAEKILKLIPIEKLILFVVSFLRGIKPEQWKLAITIVKNAALSFPQDKFPDKPSRDRARRDWAVTQLLGSGLLPGQAAHLIEMVVPYLQAIERK